ncbi:amino acid ABC transporter substrate-binding protein [Burkholderia sp. SFA1]|uniref:substrate-binding domain-containing protein n=1 Tax=unclassified Caballeronia TaxID=2646786 RepID=UPI0002387CFA|nr:MULTISPECIES: substrate-binding domain-containing protein [unclassified Caballeronia]AET92060.1 extracellular solute-binding protein [Burkholderia sp. YI23]MCE4545473.1 substrate-binding domain-containing protein [Caballeronia sp. PC1]MCE4570899.1 substrate-binding domain-containing protein [Caballeronia sp. CLC5]BBP99258.1 amino acid ABC transporter substrate-binding protein [Burkholderia sp. SFA1]
MSDRNASRAASFRFAAALCAALAAFSAQPVFAQQGASAPPPNLPNNDGADGVLRVCADPNNMPLSNKKGEGYENKIASQMASDFGYKLEYTYWPQRMGFVRNTLREKVPQSERFKCDLIIGVPKGYELTATTRPYLHSTYAMVFPNKPEYASIKSPSDLMNLPPDQLKKMKLGIFVKSPAVDWLLRNNLIDQAVSYQGQSGDPEAFPGEMIEHDLVQGNVDAAFVWGPIAGYFANRSDNKVRLVPFPAGQPIRFDYEISMGVRYGEKAWRDKVDNWIASNQPKIDQILSGYQVPLLPLQPVAAQ